MIHNGKNVTDLKIAYIGGGSKGWAWGLMSDLAVADDISGSVYLYDIDYDAAKANEIIGNTVKNSKGAVTDWKYVAVKTIDEALSGADFVVISILPGTMDEMHSDVHCPEKYGIYQSVGDSTGPGGIVRSLRTIPMMQDIANAVKKNCPEAWVINYTNPMTVCVKTLYETFPEIKAFGCCHEVFGTQKLLTDVLKEYKGIEGVKRNEIKVNVIGVNHFTWLTSAKYKNIDLFPLYKEFCEKYGEEGYGVKADTNWMNDFWEYAEKVKMELFLRYGYIAAAGDRHLAEFCSNHWYLASRERVAHMKFGLTPVDFRRENYKKLGDKSARLVSGEEQFEITETGEEGVMQIRALLGLEDLVTNVNIPNKGQIPNLPIGAVVESNAVFSDNSVVPVFAGEIPTVIHPLIARICDEQQMIVKAGIERDLELAFIAFLNDPLVSLAPPEARALFDEMIQNTKKYLTMYDIK